MPESERTDADAASVEKNLIDSSISANRDQFRHRPSHQLVAVLDDLSQMPTLTTALKALGVSLGQVGVLYGPDGRDVLDVTGSLHGRWSHLVRTLQRLGYDGNTLVNYDEALKQGHVVVHLAIPAAQLSPVVDLLRRHHLSEIGYFGAGTFEQFR